MPDKSWSSFQAQNTDRFQHTQRAYRIRFRSVLGYIETYFHMALSSQIIDFIGLYSLNDTYQRTTVGHIPNADSPDGSFAYHEPTRPDKDVRYDRY